MKIIDLEADAWHQIWNSRYRALQRITEGESAEVPKDIYIVDRGGGRRTVDLVEEAKVLKREQNRRLKRTRGR
jgi:hypothetical protein